MTGPKVFGVEEVEAIKERDTLIAAVLRGLISVAEVMSASEEGRKAWEGSLERNFSRVPDHVDPEVFHMVKNRLLGILPDPEDS